MNWVTECTEDGDVTYCRLKLGEQIDRVLLVKAYRWIHIPSGEKGVCFVQGVGSSKKHWLTALLNKWNSMGEEWVYVEATEARRACLHTMASGILVAE